MVFDQWQRRMEEITGLTGHGSRKKIADLLGLTSETIKNSEKAGVASAKMVKGLMEIIEEKQQQMFPKLHGEGGRWNASRVQGGVYVTHVLAGLAFTAYFEGDDMKISVYSEIEKKQLLSLIEEARAVRDELMAAGH